MNKISSKHKKFLNIILEKGEAKSSDIHTEIVKAGEDLSLVTVKRMLSEMVAMGLLDVSGSGPATAYTVSTTGRINADIDAKKYCATEPDKRFGLSTYTFDLFSALPPRLFSDEEIKIMDGATAIYNERVKDVPEAIQKKELERLIIELSWKSSKIEGNTYTLLDTERLLLENKEAPGHSASEARMILNHKNAFNFIHDNKTEFKNITLTNLEKLHTILVQDLSIGFGLRNKLVGVVGSKYRPLDNGYQIKEAVEALIDAVRKAGAPEAKALIALTGICYVQPFEDGNKRTSRLMANALLLAHDRAPLSYRSVDEDGYREAMLVFYEINSIIPIKNIFVDQYEFAAKNYAVK